MYRRVLVPIDGSDSAREGLLEALSLALAYGSKLCLLHVIDESPLADDPSTPEGRACQLEAKQMKGRAILEEGKAMCAAADLQAEAHLHELRDGSLAEAIVGRAAALGCELIVIGSHGRRGLRRVLMGSDAEALLRTATMPVMVVRPGSMSPLSEPVEDRLPYGRLLVPVDGSEASDRGLDEAIALARVSKGHVRLLHVIDELSIALALNPLATVGTDWRRMLREGGEALLAWAAQRVRAAGLEVDTRLIEGFQRRLGKVVADEARAWLPDLIVLGSHGRRGVDRAVLGSDASRVLGLAPLPVLVVPAPRADALSARAAST